VKTSIALKFLVSAISSVVILYLYIYLLDIDFNYNLIDFDLDINSYINYEGLSSLFGKLSNSSQMAPLGEINDNLFVDSNRLYVDLQLKIKKISDMINSFVKYNNNIIPYISADGVLGFSRIPNLDNLVNMKIWAIQIEIKKFINVYVKNYNGNLSSLDFSNRFF